MVFSVDNIYCVLTLMVSSSSFVSTIVQTCSTPMSTSADSVSWLVNCTPTTKSLAISPKFVLSGVPYSPCFQGRIWVPSTLEPCRTITLLCILVRCASVLISLASSQRTMDFSRRTCADRSRAILHPSCCISSCSFFPLRSPHVFLRLYAPPCSCRFRRCYTEEQHMAYVSCFLDFRHHVRSQKDLAFFLSTFRYRSHASLYVAAPAWGAALDTELDTVW